MCARFCSWLEALSTRSQQHRPAELARARERQKCNRSALTFVPGGHDGTVKARPDATVHLDEESGVIENLEQVLLWNLAPSSFELRQRFENNGA